MPYRSERNPYGADDGFESPNPYAPGYRKKQQLPLAPPVPPVPSVEPVQPTQPASQADVRISDAERNDAVEALGSHFAVGRLNLDEYDLRVSHALEATTQSQLEALFQDLPVLQQDAEPMPMYSAAEVERIHRKGSRMKHGVFLLSSMAAFLGAIWSTTTPPDQRAALAAFFLTLIPVLWVLLYVLKVGPSDWHMPSNHQLQRQRLRTLRLEQAFQQQQRRAQRKEITSEITDSAFRYARDKFRK